MIVFSQIEQNKTKNQKMDDNRVQIIERLKQSNNVLVTVNNNPSVDQLAACIGVTLLLNKLGKHATAVFSGEVPSTIEFLKPEETLEKNTDSLRDFIISLDKSKADKLRYKVEDTMVKIFITPYKTSITDHDLDFSQGDFNVDVVLALGIHEKEQVDQAIMAHGRILHDAVVMSVNNQQGSTIGSINWEEDQASSLSEMITSIADELQQQSLDEQIATALLTGIVAETERFRNDKTTSVTMSMSSKLMSAGANQQLVATELEPEPVPEPEPEPDQPIAIQEDVPVEETVAKEEDDGAIIIDHPEDRPPEPPAEPELPPIDPNEIDIDNDGRLRRAAELADDQNVAKDDPGDQEDSSNVSSDSRLVVEPPTRGGTLTANSMPEQLDPSTDPLTDDSGTGPLLNHKVPSNDQTLEQIEEAVHRNDSDQEPVGGTKPTYPTSYFDTRENTGQQPEPAPDMGGARDAVSDAINSADADGNSAPVADVSVGSSPVDLNLGHDAGQPVSESPPIETPPPVSSTAQPQFPPNLVSPSSNMPAENTASDVESPESPPPVPPPMMPPTPPMDSSSTTSPQ